MTNQIKKKERKKTNKIKSKQKKYNIEQKINEKTGAIGFTHIDKRYIGYYYCEVHNNNDCFCDSMYDSDYEDWRYCEELSDYENWDEYLYVLLKKRAESMLDETRSILETTFAAGIGDLEYLKELYKSKPVGHKWGISTTLWAAKNDNIDCFKYAIEYDCPYDREMCKYVAGEKVKKYLSENSEEKIIQIQKLKSCEVLYETYNVPKDIVKYIILSYL